MDVVDVAAALVSELTSLGVCQGEGGVVYVSEDVVEAEFGEGFGGGVGAKIDEDGVDGVGVGGVVGEVVGAHGGRGDDGLERVVGVGESGESEGLREGGKGVVEEKEEEWERRVHVIRRTRAMVHTRHCRRRTRQGDSRDAGRWSTEV